MRPSRLNGMAGIGVDRMGNRADASADNDILRLENLDTNLPLPKGVLERTKQAIGRDDRNSYLPFLGTDGLRKAATQHVSRVSGVDYNWKQSTIISAGGLNGILNVLLATIEPGDEVLMPDPIYIGLINRVRLAGGVPVFIPSKVEAGQWVMDVDKIAGLISSKTRMFLMMSPTMPSGMVINRAHWESICKACVNAKAWMLWDSAMESILFDGREIIHPASFQGMADRTITVGSVSKEFRMIGWRIGWITGPANIMSDIGLVNISNNVCQVGLAMDAAEHALAEDLTERSQTVQTLQKRRDVLIDELQTAGLNVIVPGGGWSLLVDCEPLGLSPEQLSQSLFEKAKIAATPMIGWGSRDTYLRFVFSNETLDRLQGLGKKVKTALS